MAIAIREDALASVGLPRDEVDRLSQLEPEFGPPTTVNGEGFERDAQAASRFFQTGQALLERLPMRPDRSADEQAAADALIEDLRQVRIGFLRRHPGTLYAQRTNDRSDFVRVGTLVSR